MMKISLFKGSLHEIHVIDVAKQVNNFDFQCKNN